jgi:Protein of unknown function (DUF402)
MAGRAIVEPKETLAGERRRFACRLLASGPVEAVVPYRLPRAGQVGDVALPRGTLSLGYFWEARSFNAYHWVAPGGGTLALYVNIADRTRIGRATIAWRDLSVDLLITPTGAAASSTRTNCLPTSTRPSARRGPGDLPGLAGGSGAAFGGVAGGAAVTTERAGLL